MNTNLKSFKGTIKDTILYEHSICETEPSMNTKNIYENIQEDMDISVVPSSNILKRKRY